VVWNLGVNGVSNANWNTTPLRQTWMVANNVTNLDFSPYLTTITPGVTGTEASSAQGIVTITYSSGTVVTGAYTLLPAYLRPVISS
jgi:hypothetical protein